jgi:hypothetical protein
MTVKPTAKHKAMNGYTGKLILNASNKNVNAIIAKMLANQPSNFQLLNTALSFRKLKNDLDHICDMNEAIIHPTVGLC